MQDFLEPECASRSDRRFGIIAPARLRLADGAVRTMRTGSRSWAALAALGAATLASSAAGQTAGPIVGLGPYELGMTLQAVRAIPIKGQREEELYISCAGDGDLAVPEDQNMTAAGVMECSPAYFVGHGSTTALMSFGDIILLPTFRFHQIKLYEITPTPDMNWRQPFEDALILKYGKPHRSATSEVSNAFGAKWTKVTSEWKFGTQSILVEAPGALRDTMAVTYSDTAQSAGIDNAVRLRRASRTGI